MNLEEKRQRRKRDLEHKVETIKTGTKTEQRRRQERGNRNRRVRSKWTRHVMMTSVTWRHVFSTRWRQYLRRHGKAGGDHDASVVIAGELLRGTNEQNPITKLLVNLRALSVLVNSCKQLCYVELRNNCCCLWCTWDSQVGHALFFSKKNNTLKTSEF